MRALSLAGLLAVSALLSACGFVPSLFKARNDPQVVAAVHAKVKDKKFIAVAYEGVPDKDGRRQSVFRFEKSAVLDRALVGLRCTVADRALIQTLLENEPLPETGSFKQEDLARIYSQSQAEILIIGYSYVTQKQNLLLGPRDVSHVILRAIDLRTREVVNSVEADGDDDDDTWRALVAQLLYAGNES